MMEPSPKNTNKRCALRRWITLFSGLATSLGALSGLIIGVAIQEFRSHAYRDTLDAANLAAMQYDLFRETINYYAASVEHLLLEHDSLPSEFNSRIEQLPKPHSISGLIILNSEGVVLHATGKAIEAPGDNLASQPFVKTLMHAASDEPTIMSEGGEFMSSRHIVRITQPIISPNTGPIRRFIVMSIVGDNLLPGFLKSSSSLVGPTAIINNAGVILAASEGGPARAGDQAGPKYTRLLQGVSGNTDWHSQQDGVLYRVGYARTSGAPFMAVVLSSTDKEWARIRLLFGILTLMVLSTSAAITLALRARCLARVQKEQELGARILRRDHEMLSAIAESPRIFIFQSSSAAFGPFEQRRAVSTEYPPWLKDSLHRLLDHARDTTELRYRWVDRFSFGGEKKSISWRLLRKVGEEPNYTYLAVGYDISELEEAQRTAFELSKMATLGEMSTGLAHELSQPLNLIGITAANLERLVVQADLKSGPEKVARIRAQVERAKKIIDHMRLYGRKVDPNATCDPAGAVEGALLVVGEEFRLADIQLCTEVEPGLPACRIPQTQLEQVLLNLVGNARDALLQSAADTERRIRISAQRGGGAGDTVDLLVEDTGGGVPEAIRPKIFVPFFTTKDPGKGTGLGLSICHGILRSVGGTIAYEDGARGGRFRVTIPIASPVGQKVA